MKTDPNPKHQPPSFLPTLYNFSKFLRQILHSKIPKSLFSQFDFLLQQKTFQPHQHGHTHIHLARRYVTMCVSFSPIYSIVYLLTPFQNSTAYTCTISTSDVRDDNIYCNRTCVADLLAVCQARRNIPCKKLQLMFANPHRTCRIACSHAALTALCTALTTPNLQAATELDLIVQPSDDWICPISAPVDRAWATIVTYCYPRNIRVLCLRNYTGGLPKTLAALLTKAHNLVHLSFFNSRVDMSLRGVNHFNIFVTQGLDGNDCDSLRLLINNNQNTVESITLHNIVLLPSLSNKQRRIKDCFFLPVTQCLWLSQVSLNNILSYVIPDNPTRTNIYPKYIHRVNYDEYEPSQSTLNQLSETYIISRARQAFFPDKTDFSDLTETEKVQLISTCRHSTGATFRVLKALNYVFPRITSGPSLEEITSTPTALRCNPPRACRPFRSPVPVLPRSVRESFANFIENALLPRTTVKITDDPTDSSYLIYDFNNDTVSITTSTHDGFVNLSDRPTLAYLLQVNTIVKSAIRHLRLATQFWGTRRYKIHGPECFILYPSRSAWVTFLRLFQFLAQNLISFDYGLHDNLWSPSRQEPEDKRLAQLIKLLNPQHIEKITIRHINCNLDCTLKVLAKCAFPKLHTLHLLGIPKPPFGSTDVDTKWPTAPLIANIRETLTSLRSTLQHIVLKDIPNYLLVDHEDSHEALANPVIEDHKLNPIIQSFNFSIAIFGPPYHTNYIHKIDCTSLAFGAPLFRACELLRLPWPCDLQTLQTTQWLNLLTTIKTRWAAVNYILCVHETDNQNKGLPSKLHRLTPKQWVNLLITLQHNTTATAFILAHWSSYRFLATLLHGDFTVPPKTSKSRYVIMTSLESP